MDGSEIASVDVTVNFDIDGNGTRDAVSWISPGQAFLALDRDHSGKIESGAEISFVQDLPGATTDLEGLTAFDSNHDGVFDAADARFGEFLVWQDANSDGVSDAGELRSLAEAGIASIDLSIDRLAPAEGDKVQVYGTSTFTRTDGTTGTVGDVGLTWDHAPGAEATPRPDLAAGAIPASQDALAALRAALAGDAFADPTHGGVSPDFSANVVEFDPRLTQMIQAIGAFGTSGSASDLLKRQVQIDSGVDWFGATAA